MDYKEGFLETSAVKSSGVCRSTDGGREAGGYSGRTQLFEWFYLFWFSFKAPQSGGSRSGWEQTPKPRRPGEPFATGKKLPVVVIWWQVVTRFHLL